MPYEVIMPKAGMSMEFGTVKQWLRQPGEYVEAGEPLLEIESDKVSMEVEAEVSGYLLAVLAHEGDEIPVTQTIAYLGATKDESIPEPNAPADAPAPGDISATATPTVPVRATPAARRIATERGVDLASIAPRANDGVIYVADVRGPDAAVSSLGRRMAASHGIEPDQIAGSGPGGRVVARDVSSAAAQIAAVGGAPNFAQAVREEIAVSRTRRIIAERMLESHLTIPSVTLTMKADVSALFQLRADLRRDEIDAPSVNDFIVRAVAIALGEHEVFRTHMIEGRLYRYSEANIGIAVDTADGLLVPVVHRADELTVFEIREAARRLSERARAGRLGPADIADGVFTISNLGMLGVESFTAMINPPQSGILSVGAAEAPGGHDPDSMSERRVMRMGLTMDHRVADGAQGARFLGTIRQLLQQPLRLIS